MTAGVYRSARQTKVYQAVGQILVSGDRTRTSSSPRSRIIQGQAIRHKVAVQVPGAGSASASAGGRIVTVAVAEPGPERAAQAVAAYIRTYIDYRQEQRVQQLLESTNQTRKQADDRKAQVDALTEEYETKLAELDERALPFDGEGAGGGRGAHRRRCP